MRDIFEYINERSPQGARTVIEEIINAAARLRQFPLLGERLHDYPQRDYRQLVVRSYRLLYRFEDDTQRLIVLRLVHAARDLDRAIGGDEDQ